MLLDRNSEREVLDRLLEGARAGQSGALVLRGDPGMGKTVLLEYAVEALPGFRVLRTLGAESERQLAFAGLHQLCAPMLDGLGGLPGPQRDALAITFGLSAGMVPDQFLVSLAVLSLLSEAAGERPLLCVIDDAQWLDRASTQTLAFVARRLLAESVVMLFAAREPGDELAGLPDLEIEGLEDADARVLLQSAIPWPLDERVRDQIVAETRGNPLALLELPRGLSSAQLASGFGLLGVKSTSGRIEASFLRRLRELPADTQRWLLLAAADPVGDPALLWRAADLLAVARDSFEPAENAGLVEVAGSVRFRHPLVRSAIYGAAPPEERRKVHRALAEAIDVEVDPDRRAWHLAEATASPDDEVAAELERCAGRAQARGGLAAAAAFLERAAALTLEPSRRAERGLMAARAKYEAGMLDDALALLHPLNPGALDDHQRASAQLLSAQIAFASRRGSDAPPLLLEAARDLETIDPSLARETYLEALSAAMFAGRLAHGQCAVEISEAALAGPPPLAARRPPELLLHGLAVQFTAGYAAGVPILKEALRAFRDEAVMPPREARWLWFASWVALHLWDDEAWTVLSTRHLDLVRESGALTALPFVLTNRSSFYAWAGEMAVAASLEEELRAATEATGIAPVPYGALSIAALRGREAEFSELVRTSVSEAEKRGEGLALTVTEMSSAALYLGLSRYDDALSAVRQAEGNDEMGPAIWMLTQLIEAAVRTGQPHLAASALERLAETTQAAGTDWALGLEARCRALLSDGEVAELLYREAIERLANARLRLEFARAHLLYGEWLRRERRRLDARERLRTALDMFRSMGTEAFGDRAERELLATGERVRKRTVETRDELTSQEAQIARMASEGLSNAEIGERLFISQHTVAYHLRKVFSKLNISSRNQLHSALPTDPGATAAA